MSSASSADGRSAPLPVPLSAARARLAAGAPSVPVAGRLRRRDGGWALADATGELPVEPPAGAKGGDLVRGDLSGTSAPYRLENASIVAASSGPPHPADLGLAERLPAARARAAMLAAIRSFFAERGFLEVETPQRVICPGLEPHLVAIRAGRDRFLATSPELHLKRLLAAGAARLFEIARAHRGDERGPWHLTEFTLLEWYRAYEGLDALVRDVAELLPEAVRAAGGDPADARGCDLTAEPERLTVREAVRRHAGVDLAEHRSPEELASALDALGIAHAPGDTWDDLFFRLMLERVESHLGRERITILEDYPASQAALARVRDDPGWPVALRFEVYAGGIELANAFDELTDPEEQRRRHEADRAARAAAGRETPPLDEAFLAALAHGHPPAAGIALGVDRLLALALGVTVRKTVLFPDEV